MWKAPSHWQDPLALQPVPGRGSLQCKEEAPGTAVGQPALDDETGKKIDEEEEPVLRCARCGHFITRPAEGISVNGSHRHTFVNPHGLMFEIGCFQAAPGCAHLGRATGEFTWFPGYQWRVAVCAGCLFHLGWRFVSSGTSFHGLILDHLAGGHLSGGAP